MTFSHLAYLRLHVRNYIFIQRDSLQGNFLGKILDLLSYTEASCKLNGRFSDQKKTLDGSLAVRLYMIAITPTGHFFELTHVLGCSIENMTFYM